MSLPDETSLRAPLGAEAGGSGGTPPLPVPVGSGVVLEEDGYMTVSSVHRLAEIAGRHRRRQWLTATAVGVVLGVGGALAAGTNLLPFLPVGRRPAPAVTAPAAPATMATPAPVTPPAPSATLPTAKPSAAPPTTAPPTTAPPPSLPAPAAPTAAKPAPDETSGEEGAPEARPRSGRGPAESRGKRSLARGLQALASGEYMRAIQELEGAVESSPSHHEAFGALAEAEFELARYGRALAHARRAATLAPRNPSYRVLVGDACFKLQRLREAAEAYTQAAILAPHDTAVQARQARVKEKLGNARP